MDISHILVTGINLYIALVITIFFHELGHLPKKIKFKWGIIPAAAAIQAKSRIGGLVVNVLLFSLVFIYKPEWILMQYVGLIAWIHFILYSFVGSILPEPKESQVNIKTYVFDDVDNKKWIWFWTAAFIAFMLFQDYYLPIISGVFS